jgi:glutamate dehydrogenase
VAEALEDALPKEAAAEWRQRCEELADAGIRAELALWLGSLPLLSAATDIALVAERTKQPIAQVTATYFAAESFFRLNRIVAAARTIQTTDYFDRLALDRARDSIGEAERRITAAMVGTGAAGEAAVEAWVKPRSAEVERIRAAVHEIAGSGLTLSKLAVTASLLGDLAKG